MNALSDDERSELWRLEVRVFLQPKVPLATILRWNGMRATLAHAALAALTPRILVVAMLEAESFARYSQAVATERASRERLVAVKACVRAERAWSQALWDLLNAGSKHLDVIRQRREITKSV